MPPACCPGIFQSITLLNTTPPLEREVRERCKSNKNLTTTHSEGKEQSLKKQIRQNCKAPHSNWTTEHCGKAQTAKENSPGSGNYFCVMSSQFAGQNLREISSIHPRLPLLRRIWKCASLGKCLT
eukprot:4134016-Amphidinium_carterae.2